MFILLAILVCEVVWMTHDGYIYGNLYDWSAQHAELPGYMRQLFYDTGKFFPDFAANLGMGQNIYYIAYYGLFSPIVLPSYLLPSVSMVTYMTAASIVMAALSIILIYRLALRHMGRWAAFMAALVFTLAGPVIYHSHHHIMFVCYLPFLILAMEGIEDFAADGRKVKLILSTLCLILSCYYFAFSSAFALCFYAVFIYMKNGGRLLSADFVKAAVRFVKTMVVPVLMSAVLWLPVLYILISGRAATSTDVSLSDLFLPHFQGHTILYGYNGMGLSALFLLALAWCLTDGKKALRFAGIVYLAFMYFGCFSYALNAGMYLNGKSLIPFLPLAAVISGKFVESVWKKDLHIKPFAATAAVIAAASIITWDGTGEVRTGLAADLALCFAMVIIIYAGKVRAVVSAALAGVMLIPPVIYFIGFNSTDQLLAVRENPRTVYGSDAEWLQKKAEGRENSLFRSDLAYSKSTTANYVLDSSMMRTSIYSSLNNRNYREYFFKESGNEVSNRSNATVKLVKNPMNALMMGDKYIISPGKKAPVAGYRKIAEKGKLSLYENSDAVPFGYSGRVFEPEWQNISEKTVYNVLKPHAAFSHGGLLLMNLAEERTVNIPIQPSDRARIIRLTMHVDNSAYKNTENGNSRTGEIHITADGILNVLSNPNWRYFNENDDFTYTMYIEPGASSIGMKLGRGIYSLSDIRLNSFDYSDYSAWRNGLTGWQARMKKGTDNVIEGKIEAGRSGSMIINIPYDDGFEITVDGKKTGYSRAGNSMIRIPLTAGSHYVKVTFNAPWKKAGMAVTAAGWALFAAYGIYTVKRRKEGQKNHE